MAANLSNPNAPNRGFAPGVAVSLKFTRPYYIHFIIACKARQAILPKTTKYNIGQRIY
jgi:hypothetical protein